MWFIFHAKRAHRLIPSAVPGHDEGGGMAMGHTKNGEDDLDMTASKKNKRNTTRFLRKHVSRPLVTRPRVQKSAAVVVVVVGARKARS